jgi:dTDP-4-dehydrorhamnose reductase
MSTVLLTGAGGQVGWELARALMPLGTVVMPGRERCDLARPETLAKLVDEVRPQIIVNAAAYTAVDQAEKEPDLAMTVNADAPGELAAAGRKHGALLVHYSTDYVFDGRKAAPYLEDDPPNPLGAYGRSKLAGEEAIRAAGGDFLIFRTSWVYSARGRNFARTILRLAGELKTLQVVDDQVGAPTWARLVAETTALALHRDLALRRRGAFQSGLLNLTASGATSWHGFASAIVSAARERNAPLKCREVAPIPTAKYPLLARRPANSRLYCGMLKVRYGLAMPSWETGLRLVMDELGAADKAAIAA